MSKRDKINDYVCRQISFLTNSLGSGRTKAQLAQLRRGVGKRPGQLPELWGMFLQDLPEEFMGTGNEPTYAEWAIYTALTLFALHQQGHMGISMNLSGRENRLGCAVRRLVHNEADERRISLKLGVVADSDDMEELSYRLKNLTKLLSNEEIKLDYADLAVDLYQFQFEDSTDGVRLKWGQDFYRYQETDENRKEEKDEEK